MDAHGLDLVELDAWVGEGADGLELVEGDLLARVVRQALVAVDVVAVGREEGGGEGGREVSGAREGGLQDWAH